MQPIDDPDHPALDDYRHLDDAAARRAVESRAKHGIFIVEGRRVVERLVGAGFEVRSVLVTPSKVEPLRPTADALGTELLVAPRDVLARVAGFDVHRGVLASVRRPDALSVDAVLARADRCVALEGVNDNENLGAVYRTAAGLGIDAVLLDDRCADPLYRRSVRVSLGWSMLLPTVRVGPLPQWFTTPAARGRRVIALTPRADAFPVDVAASRGVFDGPTVLLVGAEGPGLSPEALAAADVLVRIPMAGGVDSLNLATAFGVVAAFAGAREGWRHAQE